MKPFLHLTFPMTLIAPFLLPNSGVSKAFVGRGSNIWRRRFRQLSSSHLLFSRQEESLSGERLTRGYCLVQSPARKMSLLSAPASQGSRPLFLFTGLPFSYSLLLPSRPRLSREISILGRLGVRSLVLEQGDSLRTGGTALTLFKNGWRVLDAIGVGDELRSRFLQIEG